jgi:hypothetical protein
VAKFACRGYICRDASGPRSPGGTALLKPSPRASMRDAVDEIAAETGAPRREVYAKALEMVRLGKR